MKQGQGKIDNELTNPELISQEENEIATDQTNQQIPKIFCEIDISQLNIQNQNDYRMLAINKFLENPTVRQAFQEKFESRFQQSKEEASSAKQIHYQDFFAYFRDSMYVIDSGISIYLNIEESVQELFNETNSFLSITRLAKAYCQSLSGLFQQKGAVYLKFEQSLDLIIRVFTLHQKMWVLNDAQHADLKQTISKLSSPGIVGLQQKDIQSDNVKTNILNSKIENKQVDSSEVFNTSPMNDKQIKANNEAIEESKQSENRKDDQSDDRKITFQDQLQDENKQEQQNIQKPPQDENSEKIKQNSSRNFSDESQQKVRKITFQDDVLQQNKQNQIQNTQNKSFESQVTQTQNYETNSQNNNNTDIQQSQMNSYVNLQNHQQSQDAKLIEQNVQQPMDQKQILNLQMLLPKENTVENSTFDTQFSFLNAPSILLDVSREYGQAGAQKIHQKIKAIGVPTKNNNSFHQQIGYDRSQRFVLQKKEFSPNTFKTLSEQEINHQLHEIYQFYCRQCQISGKFMSFDRLEQEMQIMRLGPWYLFCKTFNMYAKKNIHATPKSSDLIRKSTIDPYQMKNLYVDLQKSYFHVENSNLDRTHLSHIFKTCSGNKSFLEFQGFLRALKYLAESVYGKELQNEEDQLCKLYEQKLLLGTGQKYKKQLKQFNAPFGSLDKCEDSRVHLDRIIMRNNNSPKQNTPQVQRARHLYQVDRSKLESITKIIDEDNLQKLTPLQRNIILQEARQKRLNQHYSVKTRQNLYKQPNYAALSAERLIKQKDFKLKRSRKEQKINWQKLLSMTEAQISDFNDDGFNPIQLLNLAEENANANAQNLYDQDEYFNKNYNVFSSLERDQQEKEKNLQNLLNYGVSSPKKCSMKPFQLPALKPHQFVQQQMSPQFEQLYLNPHRNHSLNAMPIQLPYQMHQKNSSINKNLKYYNYQANH